MTIAELIETLHDLQVTYGPNIEVMTSANYGDICRTEQLNEIKSIEANEPVESAYSHSGLAFGTSDESDENEFDYQALTGNPVIVLRYTC